MACNIEQHPRQNKHPIVTYGKLPGKTVITRPWFEAAIDSIGPYEIQSRNNDRHYDSTREIQAVTDASSNEAAYIFDRLWGFFELLESYDITAVPTTTHNPQANGITERLHRVIGDKMRTQRIGAHLDLENFLHNAKFTLRASVHSTMPGVSPAQATFGRDMIFDRAQHARKLEQVCKNNLRENAGRRAWKYQSGDRILLKRDGNINSKLTTLYDGPFVVVAVRDNGTLVIDKGQYTETVHIRRNVPYKDQRGEDSELPDKTSRGEPRKQTTALSTTA
ncbi:LOW QUALITY PROTEIN: Pol Polyprotein [Phytophthora megakarya]|uniref:Pol Polyprotein n=1 Tax=Phytophthora megakarya TaxID=4795 RepID=A0A225UVH6_9STRA|nr:LOW QUALITY PROTEIN: Pol Polyprotein [Phytophthora megakarya]